MSATDRYSHQLLYATVRQRLLDDIAQGVYQAGQQIPTENELCTQYNVSRILFENIMHKIKYWQYSHAKSAAPSLHRCDLG